MWGTAGIQLSTMELKLHEVMGAWRVTEDLAHDLACVASIAAHALLGHMGR